MTALIRYQQCLPQLFYIQIAAELDGQTVAMSTSSLRRQVKNIVHNYSEAEIKVLCSSAYLFFSLDFIFTSVSPVYLFQGKTSLGWRDILWHLIICFFLATLSLYTSHCQIKCSYLFNFSETNFQNLVIRSRLLCKNDSFSLSHADYLIWPFLVLLCRLERQHPMTPGAQAALWCQRLLT